jgi:hypothetical protein
MSFDRSRLTARSVFIVAACALLFACADESPPDEDSRSPDDGPLSKGSDEERDAGDPFGNASGSGDAQVGGGDASTAGTSYRLTPENPVLNIEHGQDAPTLQFEVHDSRGKSVPARFELDNAELGTIGEFGLFTAFGTRGGDVNVEARIGDRLVRTVLTVQMSWIQNGGIDDPNNEPSSGGRGGVGGEGQGSAVSDEIKAVLDGKPESDAMLRFLYPYDGTVMPLGLLAPLLMWSEPEGGAVDVDGVQLHLSGSNFEYRGYFARPPALAADKPFVRHPIPQDVWQAATHTVAGAALAIEVTLSKGGKAIGPMTTALTIAAGTLKGTVYYQSYGTNLAKNYGGARGGDGRFGGATLAIKPGATAPVLVAGGDGDSKQCRVCHSVSADGSRMTVQHGDDYDRTSSYDLRNNYDELVYGDPTSRKLGWIGLSPDGALGLANGEPLGFDAAGNTELYDMVTGDVVPSTGLTGFVNEAAMPMFSHDGLRVAFNLFTGAGDATTGAGDGKKLVAMDFDPMTMAFSNAQLLYSDPMLAAGWPTFSPTGNGVFWQLETRRGDENRFFYTRYGARGELWWTNLKNGQAHKLEHVNGTDSGMSYLPTSPDNHDLDEQLNYEPTIAPIASGGYAWMVFTSRRLYGNVATIDPWHSDPRDHDLTETPTTKKLWVAAIDLDVDTPELSVEVGEDPSHPAFYLPGQELLAGNTRGFWSVDPCKADGMTCESGVDCCGGFCQRDDASGEMTCGRKVNECANEFDRCETRADCCDPELLCINNVCSKVAVQ